MQKWHICAYVVLSVLGCAGIGYGVWSWAGSL